MPHPPAFKTVVLPLQQQKKASSVLNVEAEIPPGIGLRFKNWIITNKHTAASHDSLKEVNLGKPGGAIRHPGMLPVSFSSDEPNNNEVPHMQWQSKWRQAWSWA